MPQTCGDMCSPFYTTGGEGGGGQEVRRGVLGVASLETSPISEQKNRGLQLVCIPVDRRQQGRFLALQLERVHVGGRQVNKRGKATACRKGFFAVLQSPRCLEKYFARHPHPNSCHPTAVATVLHYILYTQLVIV